MFNDLLKNVILIDYTQFKGSYIYDYSLVDWLEKIKTLYLKYLKNHDHIVASSFIKLEVLNLEKKLIGPMFNPQIFKLEDRMLKPTSQFMVYDTDFFKKKTKSFNFLPYKFTLINTVYRNESRTKPLIRQNQINYFMESHYSGLDSKQQVKEIIKIYAKLLKYLKIPFFIVKRDENDKFQGANSTYAFETIIHSENKTLQIATVHDLDENYSKILNLTYKNKNNIFEFIKQASYGISGERICAKLIDNLTFNILPNKFQQRELILFKLLDIPAYFKKSILKVHVVNTNEVFIKTLNMLQKRHTEVYVIGQKELVNKTYKIYKSNISNKNQSILKYITILKKGSKESMLNILKNSVIIKAKTKYFELIKNLIDSNNIKMNLAGTSINEKYVYFSNKY